MKPVPEAAGDSFGIRAATERVDRHRTRTRAVAGLILEQLIALLAFTPFIAWGAALSWAVLASDSPVPWACLLLLCLWTGLFFAEQCRWPGPRPGERGRIQPSVTTPESGPGRRVAVIGAGPVGLAVTKECKALGLEVVNFERAAGVGGVYRYDEQASGGVWKSVRLTTSPWVTAFSDFPPRDRSVRHLMHDEYVEYLEQYAQHFELEDSLRLNHEVLAVEPLSSTSSSTSREGWQVTYRDGGGDEQSQEFDSVAVCVGLNLNPKDVNIPGQESFPGEVTHVARYKTPERFVGKDVVVVGLGESAVDIVTELAPVARSTTLSIRRGKFLIPRINPLNGRPNDYDTNRMRYSTPIAIRDSYMLFKRRLCMWAGLVDSVAVARTQMLERSEAGPMSQTVTKNDDLVDQVLKGSLELRKHVVELDRDEVCFADGTRSRADVLMFAHGYSPTFPFMKYPAHAGARHPGLLYLGMFHPTLGESIAFCGFARPAIGTIPPTGEMQARLFAQVAAGLRALPDAAHMAADVDIERRENAERFPTQPQPNVVISWIDYMDRLAGIIGCRPDVCKLIMRPRLLWKVATGPMTGAVYRLHGPGASEVSEETVRWLPRMHPLREIFTLLGLHMLVWPFVRTHASVRWRSANPII